MVNMIPNQENKGMFESHTKFKGVFDLCFQTTIFSF